MRVTKLLHTRMRVSDMDQTIRFYQHVLGLEVLERKVSPRGSHLAFLKVPNSEELIELCSFPASGPVTVQEDLCLLYTSDAADDLLCVDLGGRRSIKKKNKTKTNTKNRMIKKQPACHAIFC